MVSDVTVQGMLSEGADGKLIAPENILKRPAALRSIYQIFREQHLPRTLLYSKIEGQIAGNPPYDPAELEASGLGHVSNFNTLDAAGQIDRACLAFWNLLYEAETLVNINIGGSTPDEKEVSNTLSRNLSDVLRLWSNFKTVTNTSITQLVQFGVSPIVWTDERCWQWDTVELAKFYVANEASTNTDKLTIVILETIVTAQFLFETYEQYKDGKESDSPWNLEELKKLLMAKANARRTANPFPDFMDVQRAYQDGSFLWDTEVTDGVRLISGLQTEYDGKISHYMIEKFTDYGEFLYFIDRQYDSLEEALLIYTASPGKFTIHSNRGVGHKIFAASQAIMRLDCNMVDSAILAGTPFLKSTSVGNKDIEQVKIFPGTMSYIGTAEFAQTQVGSNLNAQISVSQFLQSKMNYNAANSGDDPSQPDVDQGSISPTQARLKSYREFSVLKNIIQHFYSFKDIEYQNVVSKMLRSKEGYPGHKYVKEWKRRCIRDGVPEEVFKIPASQFSEINRNLPEDWTVKASRVAGDGSTVGMILALEAMAPLLGDFGPREIKAYREMHIRTFMGQDYVQTFTQDMGNPDENAGGASLAQQENNSMKASLPALVSPDNEQPTHIAIHMKGANEIIDAVHQQQMSPVDADKMMEQFIPHTEQHIEIYAKSPFSQTKIGQIKSDWKEIRKWADFNKRNAASMEEAALRKQQQDQQQTQQVMTDAQRKDFLAQRDADRADAKVNSQVARGRDASQTRAEIMKEGVTQKSENQKLDIQLKNQNKAQEIATKPQPKPPQTTQQPLSIPPPTDLATESANTLGQQIDSLAGNRPAQYDFEV